MDPQQVITYWILSFVSIFAVINPLRAATITAMISDGWTAAQRSRATRRALVITAAILFCAGWIGNHIILRSQINIGGFRIASGLLLLAIVIPRMARNRPLFERFAQHIPASGSQALAIGIFPLSIPLLCNPASVATVTLYSGEPYELWRRAVTLSALGLTLAIAWLLLRFAPRVHDFFGERGARFATHVMDLTVAAWAVDYMAVGIRDLLPLVTSTPPAGT